MKHRRVLVAQNLKQSFGSRTVFADVSFEVNQGSVLGVVGNNGAGKSTLLKILACLVRPTAGTVQLLDGGKNIMSFHHDCGVVAPWLTLYDEFSTAELIFRVAKMKGVRLLQHHIELVTDRLHMSSYRNKLVGNLSSGMRQRSMIALATVFEPSILLFDEPTITLDQQGVDCVFAEIHRAKQRGAIIVIATNDSRDLEQCTDTLSLS
jgi:heme exporter protein A